MPSAVRVDLDPLPDHHRGERAEATNPALQELTVAADELVVVGEAGLVWTTRVADERLEITIPKFHSRARFPTPR